MRAHDWSMESSRQCSGWAETPSFLGFISGKRIVQAGRMAHDDNRLYATYPSENCWCDSPRVWGSLLQVTHREVGGITDRGRVFWASRLMDSEATCRKTAETPLSWSLASRTYVASIFTAHTPSPNIFAHVYASRVPSTC